MFKSIFAFFGHLNRKAQAVDAYFDRPNLFNLGSPIPAGKPTRADYDAVVEVYQNEYNNNPKFRKQVNFWCKVLGV